MSPPRATPTTRAPGVRYYGLRYYQPSTGRFIGRDPISEQGGLNLYAFCLNNAVNKWDYLGQVGNTKKPYLVDGGGGGDVVSLGRFEVTTSRDLFQVDRYSGFGSRADTVSTGGGGGAQVFMRSGVEIQIINSSATTAATNGPGIRLPPGTPTVTIEDLKVLEMDPDLSKKTVPNRGGALATSATVAAGMTITQPFPIVIPGSTTLDQALGGLRTVFVGAGELVGGAVIFVFTPTSTGSSDYIDTPLPGFTSFENLLPNSIDASGNQVKRLSPGEIKQLQDAGLDPHELKPAQQGSRYDLFKDSKGNIQVRPKDGSGPGEPTGINVRELPKTGGPRRD